MLLLLLSSTSASSSSFSSSDTFGVSSSSSARGPRGFRGPAGGAGPQGVVGPLGATGNPGSRGAQGPLGIRGPDGLPGDQGATGATGAAGLQGPQGYQGYQGAPGLQGVSGLQGSVGATGATGAAGVQGAVGATGNYGGAGLAHHHFYSFVDQHATLDNSAAWPECEFDVCASDTVEGTCGGVGCAENMRCRADDLDIVMPVVEEPAHAGLTCHFTVQSRAAVVAEVGAGYREQPDSCRISYTIADEGRELAHTESKSVFCPVVTPVGVAPGSSYNMEPEVTLRVLSGIPACEDNQEITQEFNSDFFAATQGWKGQFYLNDRMQPTFPNFVRQNPSLVLDPSSPAAAEFRFWECSSFYFADETLGMSLLNGSRQEVDGSADFIDGIDSWDLANETETVAIGFSFAVPEPSDDLFETLNRDDGSLFIGYFNKERQFESGVWYAQALLGAQLYFPRAQTSDNFWSSDDNRGAASDTPYDLDGVPFLRLALEFANKASEDAADFDDNLVQLERGVKYRFEGEFDPVECVYTGEVFELTTTAHQYLLGDSVGTLRLQCHYESGETFDSECSDEEIYSGFFGQGQQMAGNCGARVYEEEALWMAAADSVNAVTFNVADEYTGTAACGSGDLQGSAACATAIPAGLTLTPVSENAYQVARVGYDEQLPGVTSYYQPDAQGTSMSFGGNANPQLIVLDGECMTSYMVADEVLIDYTGVGFTTGATAVSVVYSCRTDKDAYANAEGYQLGGDAESGAEHVIRVELASGRHLFYQQQCPHIGETSFFGLTLEEEGDFIQNIEFVEMVECDDDDERCGPEAGLGHAGYRSRIGQCIYEVTFSDAPIQSPRSLPVNAFGVFHEDWAEETSAYAARGDFLPLNLRDNFGMLRTGLWHDNFPENQDDFGGESCDAVLNEQIDLVPDNSFDFQAGGWALTSQRVRPGSDYATVWDVSGADDFYGGLWDKRLESEFVHVPEDARLVVLEWWQYVDTDTASDPSTTNATAVGSGAMDFGMVEIQLNEDSGAWLHVPENSFLEGPPNMLGYTQGPIQDSRFISRPEVWGGEATDMPGGVGQWRRVRLSLAQFAGLNIRFRFRFRSDNDNDVGDDDDDANVFPREGWFVEPPVMRRACAVCSEQEQILWPYGGVDEYAGNSYTCESGRDAMDGSAMVSSLTGNDEFCRTQTAGGVDGFDANSDMTATTTVAVLPADESARFIIYHMVGGQEEHLSGNVGAMAPYTTPEKHEKCLAGTLIQISVDGGDWQVVPQQLYLSGAPKHQHHDNDMPMFCDSTAQPMRSSWLRSSIDLSSFAGSSVQLRAKFEVLSGSNLEGEAYYVDTMLIVGACPGPANESPFEGVGRVEGGATACWNAKYRDADRFRRGRGGIADDHLLPEAAVGDLILDDVVYTIPATEGYPVEGDISVEAVCSGEVYQTEETA